MITANEFSLLHEVFNTIVEKELGHPIPPPPGAQEAIARNDSAPSERPASEACAQWLGLLDLAISPHKLRGYVTTEDPEEPTLVALIRFLVFKKAHSEIDRDKVDWLLTHLFKKREEQTKLPTGWPKLEIQKILYTQQGTGTFIAASNIVLPEEERDTKLAEITTELMNTAASYGFSASDIIKQLERTT